MAQSDLNVGNADGATVRADINSQLEALVTQSSGSTAPPVTFPSMRWFDTSAQQLKERNSANTAWRVVAEVVDGELVPYIEGQPLVSWDRLPWASTPLRRPFPLWDHLTGADLPPNSGDILFIRLTADDAFNDGLLINETIDGSGALLEATAEIAVGPLAGHRVHLMNTEQAVIRASETSGSLGFDQTQQITGDFLINSRGGNTPIVTTTQGAFSAEPFGSTSDGVQGASNAGVRRLVTFDSADSPDARAGDRTKDKSVAATHYMRIM